jgi:D-alanyl-D-alanine carboxypeptidase/D-alanyl-D-alanine-endopeptidase (penicillin-binding protein 4)
LAGLDHLAREIHASGVRRVTGDVIIDNRLFASAESTGSGPRHLSPIMINDNVVDVLAQPAKSPGQPALVCFQPMTQSITMDARVETVALGEEMKLEVRSVGERSFTVRGKIPVGHQRVVRIHEVEEPVSFARSLFIEALRKRDVRVDASPLDSNKTASLLPQAEILKLPKVAEYTSPPFREYTRVILKVSHNLYASTLPLLLAARRGEFTLEAGLRRQGEILKSLGIEAGSISFGGGAGGSRADLVTPRATVALLRSMAARRESAAFEAALPILGRDGTLARSIAPDSPVRGHVHAKTGTYWVDNELDGKAVLISKALAGYLETASGRQLVLALFVNNALLNAPRPNFSVDDATSAAGKMLGKLCEVFYVSDVETTPIQAERPSQALKPRPHTELRQ